MMSQQLIHNIVYMKIFLFLIIFNINVIVAYSMDTHNVAKRMDLESCIGKNDIIYIFDNNIAQLI